MTITQRLLQRRQKRNALPKKASQHWKGLAEKRKATITELQQTKNKFAGKLSSVTKLTLEIESKLIINEAMISESKVKLKRVSQGGKWQPWVVQYICELLATGTPPHQSQASLPLATRHIMENSQPKYRR